MFDFLSRLTSPREILVLLSQGVLVLALGLFVAGGVAKTHEKMTSAYSYMGWEMGRIPGTPGVGLPFSGSDLAQEATQAIESLSLDERTLVVVVLPQDANSQLVAHIATKVRFLAYGYRIRAVRAPSNGNIPNLSLSSSPSDVFLYAPDVETMPDGVAPIQDLEGWFFLRRGQS